jgi:hypothetical protein
MLWFSYFIFYQKLNMNNINFNNFNSIKYFENVFNEEQIAKIWNDYLNDAKWKYGYTSIPNSNNKFWKNDLIESKFFTIELFSTIQKLIGNNFEILKCYANGHTAFQEGDYHIDSEDDDEYTLLYYPMNEWSPEWCGETTFILPSGGYQYILPIPNGAVLFPGSWLHCGRAPSLKMPYGLRIVIIYKLRRLPS